MKASVSFRFLAAAALMGPMAPSAGWAQAAPAQMTTKVIAESDKLVVLDVVIRPGEVGSRGVRFGQVVYMIVGGKLERTFEDGTKADFDRQSGETILVDEKRPYSVQNVGTTTVHFILVQPK